MIVTICGIVVICAIFISTSYVFLYASNTEQLVGTVSREEKIHLLD